MSCKWRDLINTQEDCGNTGEELSLDDAIESNGLWSITLTGNGYYNLQPNPSSEFYIRDEYVFVIPEIGGLSDYIYILLSNSVLTDPHFNIVFSHAPYNSYELYGDFSYTLYSYDVSFIGIQGNNDFVAYRTNFFRESQIPDTFAVNGFSCSNDNTFYVIGVGYGGVLRTFTPIEVLSNPYKWE